MLIALYTIFVLGGGGSFGPMLYVDEAIDNTKVEIVDKDRQKEITASLKEMKTRAKDYTKEMKSAIKSLTPTSNPHDTHAAELDAFWNHVFELNAEFGGDFVDMRFDLRDQLSREEWEAIFPVQD